MVVSCTACTCRQFLRELRDYQTSIKLFDESAEEIVRESARKMVSYTCCWPIALAATIKPTHTLQEAQHSSSLQSSSAEIHLVRILCRLRTGLARQLRLPALLARPVTLQQ